MQGELSLHPLMVRNVQKNVNPGKYDGKNMKVESEGNCLCQNLMNK